MVSNRRPLIWKFNLINLVLTANDRLYSFAVLINWQLPYSSMFNGKTSIKKLWRREEEMSANSTHFGNSFKENHL